MGYSSRIMHSVIWPNWSRIGLRSILETFHEWFVASTTSRHELNRAFSVRAVEVHLQISKSYSYRYSMTQYLPRSLQTSCRIEGTSNCCTGFEEVLHDSSHFSHFQYVNVRWCISRFAIWNGFCLLRNGIIVSHIIGFPITTESWVWS